MSSLRETILNLVAGRPTVHCDTDFGPVESARIEEVEKALDVTIPPQFRSYLMEFAGGILFNCEIAGLPTDKAILAVPGSENCIADIVQMNQAYRGSFPKGLLYFATDEGDNLFFFDTLCPTGDGECPVVKYGPGAIGLRIADDFLQFVSSVAGE